MYCTKKFSRGDVLRKHIRQVHTSVDRQQTRTAEEITDKASVMYQCPMCIKRFTRTDNRQRHIESVHVLSGEEHRLEVRVKDHDLFGPSVIDSGQNSKCQVEEEEQAYTDNIMYPMEESTMCQSLLEVKSRNSNTPRIDQQGYKFTRTESSSSSTRPMSSPYYNEDPNILVDKLRELVWVEQSGSEWRYDQRHFNEINSILQELRDIEILR